MHLYGFFGPTDWIPASIANLLGLSGHLSRQEIADDSLLRGAQLVTIDHYSEKSLPKERDGGTSFQIALELQSAMSFSKADSCS